MRLDGTNYLELATARESASITCGWQKFNYQGSGNIIVQKQGKGSWCILFGDSCHLEDGGGIMRSGIAYMIDSENIYSAFSG